MFRFVLFPVCFVSFRFASFRFVSSFSLRPRPARSCVSFPISFVMSATAISGCHAPATAAAAGRAPTATAVAGHATPSPRIDARLHAHLVRCATPTPRGGHASPGDAPASSPRVWRWGRGVPAAHASAAAHDARRGWERDGAWDGRAQHGNASDGPASGEGRL